jgi:imidazolonepropionase-like amidohydrolase
MTRLPRFLLAIALCLAAAAAFAEPMALVGARIYTAPGAAPIADGVIVIDGERIAAVGARGTVRMPADARVIDCAGNAITAGFWNSHVHLITPALLRAERKDAAVLQAELDRMFNRWGFTTVFDLASPLANTKALRERIDRGEVRGPRVLTAGEPLWPRVPIYVAGFLAENGISMPPVRDAADARARVDAAAAAGVDGIKLFTGSVQANGVENMRVEVATQAVRAAHAHGLPVFSHAQNEAGFDVALAAGVDVIAHMVVEAGGGQERSKRMREARTALIPTLTLFEHEGVDASFVDRILGQLGMHAAAGGEILFGTDAGYIDHYDTARELQLMGRAGLSFDAVLASLTTAASRRFGRGVRSGRIAAGEPADLVVLKQDPAGDPVALSKVRITIRGGKVIHE